jgi:hypothetical protein
MQPELQQRQWRASDQACVDERGQDITKILVVGRAEEQAVDFASRLVPRVHQTAEAQPRAGKSEDSARARPIGSSAAVWRRRFGLEYLYPFDKPTELLSCAHDGCLWAGGVAAIYSLVPQETFELVTGRFCEYPPLLSIVEVAQLLGRWTLQGAALELICPLLVHIPGQLGRLGVRHERSAELADLSADYSAECLRSLFQDFTRFVEAEQGKQIDASLLELSHDLVGHSGGLSPITKAWSLREHPFSASAQISEGCRSEEFFAGAPRSKRQVVAHSAGVDSLPVRGVVSEATYDRQDAQWVCTVRELVEVGCDRHRARPFGRAGLDNGLAHGARWAVQVYARRLLGQDAHALGAFEQDAGRYGLEEV